MTDPNSTTHDAREADDVGEKPDLGRTPDALKETLSGTDSGSDTRAGSLRGGSASGSDDDPDQEAINRSLADQGRAAAKSEPQAPPEAGADPIVNTGPTPSDPVEGKRNDDADAATG